MKCKKFKKLLPGYLYGEIAERDKQVFIGHASDCAACRKLMAEMEETVILLKSQMQPVFSPGELASLRASVKEEITQVGAGRSRLPTKSFWQVIFQPRLAPVTAALILALLVGLTFLFRSPDQQDYLVAGEVNDLVDMMETIEEEFQSVSELCREIDNLQSLFPKETGPDPEVEIRGKQKNNPGIVSRTAVS